MQILSILVGGLAILLGIWYSMLGFSAVKYLNDADVVDKIAGWTLWWCIDVNRYNDEGQRLCKRGQAIASAAVMLSVVVYAFDWS